MKRLLLLLSFCIFFAANAAAALIGAQCEIDKESITIGDSVMLKASVILDGGDYIIPPETNYETGAWRVKAATVTQKSQNPNIFIIEYELTAYTASQSLPLPVFQVFYINAFGETGSFDILPDMYVKVESMLKGAVNYEDVKDIKPMEAVTIPKWQVIFLEIAVLFFMVSAASYLIKFLKRRFNAGAKPVNPQKAAEKAFIKLLKENTDNGKVLNFGGYYYGLSEILRRYIDAKYKTATLSLNGAALIAEMEKIIDANFPPQDDKQLIKHSLSEFITAAESVKYAHAHATAFSGAQTQKHFNTVKTLTEKL